jgi:hypothetical protein
VRSPPTPFKKGGIYGKGSTAKKGGIKGEVELKACDFPLGKGNLRQRKYC